MSEMLSPEEILARRLDQVLPPDNARIPPQTPDPLVNTAARMAALRIPEPSDIALARIETTVLNAFDKQYRVQRRQSRRWVSQAGRWAVAASFILVLLVAGIVPASAGSLPGEPLYGVKRLTERVELALASSPDTVAHLRLEYAERRALEALALLERDQFDAALLDEARTELRNAEQAASPELATSLTFQWQQWEVAELIQFIAERVEEPDDAAVIPTESPIATDTATPSPTRTPRPTQASDAATDCPGNSCNSAGVPGGQIDPENPPGQSGGRDDNPPTPPGQGDPGGGGAPAEPPPSNSGGNSGNSGGSGHGQSR